tara:strand:+ start:17915 stop:18556 length:642 start_codon:yes stop_codon:yes gene_type:complete
MSLRYNQKPKYWNKALNHINQCDNKLSVVIKKTKKSDYLTRSCTSFQTLANAIIGQQISISAAASITHRLKLIVGKINPINIDKSSSQNLRKSGLSAKKVIYLKELSDVYINNPSYIYDFRYLDDNTIIERLSKLYGIGEWTAHMYLIFQLNRPNVLPIGDLGIINSAKKIYNLKEQSHAKEFLLQKAKAWDPYKTVGSWFLWRAIDIDIVQY